MQRLFLNSLVSCFLLALCVITVITVGCRPLKEDDIMSAKPDPDKDISIVNTAEVSQTVIASPGITSKITLREAKNNSVLVEDDTFFNAFTVEILPGWKSSTHFEHETNTFITKLYKGENDGDENIEITITRPRGIREQTTVACPFDMGPRQILQTEFLTKDGTILVLREVEHGSGDITQPFFLCGKDIENRLTYQTEFGEIAIAWTSALYHMSPDSKRDRLKKDILEEIKAVLSNIEAIPPDLSQCRYSLKSRDGKAILCLIAIKPYSATYFKERCSSFEESDNIREYGPAIEELWLLNTIRDKESAHLIASTHPERDFFNNLPPSSKSLRKETSSCSQSYFREKNLRWLDNGKGFVYTSEKVLLSGMYSSRFTAHFYDIVEATSFSLFPTNMIESDFTLSSIFFSQEQQNIGLLALPVFSSESPKLTNFNIIAKTLTKKSVTDINGEFPFSLLASSVTIEAKFLDEETISIIARDRGLSDTGSNGPRMFEQLWKVREDES